MAAREEDISAIVNLFSPKSFDAGTYRSRPRMLVVVFTNPPQTVIPQTEPSDSTTTSTDSLKTNDDKTFDRVQRRFMQEPLELPKHDILRIEVKDTFAKAVEILMDEGAMREYLNEQHHVNDPLSERYVYTADWYDNVFYILCQEEDRFIDTKEQKQTHPKVIVGKEAMDMKDVIGELGLKEKMKAIVFQIQTIHTSDPRLESLDKAINDILAKVQSKDQGNLKLKFERI